MNIRKLRMTIGKYLSDHRKRRYELVNEPKKQANIIFIDKQLAIKVIMDCRTTAAAKKIMKRLGLKEQTVLTKIKSCITDSLYE